MNTYLCSRLHNPLHMIQHWCLRYCYILQLCSKYRSGHCLHRHHSGISIYKNISNNGIAAFCAHQNDLYHSEFITLLCYEFWVMEVVPRLFWWAQNNAIPSFEIPSTRLSESKSRRQQAQESIFFKMNFWYLLGI